MSARGGALPGDAVAECARRLRAGELVVHPAESVYGFGGLLDPKPLDALRTLKGRSSGGFVVLVPEMEEVAGLLGDVGGVLARAFWPGPLTLVVDDPCDRFPSSAKAADGSIALRVPGRPETLALLRETGCPMTSTSANAPGGRPAVTATEALEAAHALGHGMAALDAGRLPGGAASTLVRIGPGRPVLLRAGSVQTSDVARALGGDSRLVVPSRTSGAAGPFVITFVCTGNTCRSPMAEAIARRAVARRRMQGVEVRSAGVAAWLGTPASEGALRAAARSGLDLGSHRSAPLTEEMVASSSLVLCMGQGHLVEAEALGGAGRSLLLKEMAGGAGDVADPFGGSDGAYRETFAELQEAVEAVVGQIAARA